MARLVRARKLSAREVLAAHLKQIERVNPKVNAIVTLAPELAADAAAKADEMQARFFRVVMHDGVIDVPKFAEALA